MGRDFVLTQNCVKLEEDDVFCATNDDVVKPQLHAEGKCDADFPENNLVKNIYAL